MRIFMTGATGYLGLRLASDIVRAGHNLTALVRDRDRAAPLESLGARCVLGDVTDFDRAGVDLKDFDACVHAAALVRTRVKDRREFDRVNVAGVANVARRALDARISRFLYTSTFMALGFTPDGRVLDETAEHAPDHFHNDYERTKYLGLKEFEEWLKRGLAGIALMPGVIYGPGAFTSGNLTAQAIADLVLARMPGVIGDGTRVLTYSFIEDVIEGHMLALSKGRIGDRYVLGGETVSLEEFARRAALVAGVKAPTRHIPYWVAKAFALAEEEKCRITGREPRLTREVVEIYKHHWAYSCRKAQAELGYKVTPLDDGLKATVAWIKMAIREGKIK